MYITQLPNVFIFSMTRNLTRSRFLLRYKIWRYTWYVIYLNLRKNMTINRLKKEEVIGLFFMFVTSELGHLNLWTDLEKIMSLKWQCLLPFTSQFYQLTMWWLLLGKSRERFKYYRNTCGDLGRTSCTWICLYLLLETPFVWYNGIEDEDYTWPSHCITSSSLYLSCPISAMHMTKWKR